MSEKPRFKLHYRKHKYTPEKVDSALLFDIQNYNPLYTRFFDLNESNYNQLQLNQKFYIQNIDNTMKSENDDSTTNTEITPNYLETTVVDDHGNSKNIPIFVKYSPLLDPIRYLSGKYDIKDSRTNALPNFSSNESNCNEKILDKNNSSYVDGFFSYLTSKTLHDHKNVHGIDYYGSYLCKQREFSTNIYDDVEYLLDCDFFNQHEEKIYTLDFPFDDSNDEADPTPTTENTENVPKEKTNEELSIQRALKIRTKLRKMIGITNRFLDDNNYEFPGDPSVDSIMSESIVTVESNNDATSHSIHEPAVEILDIQFDDSRLDEIIDITPNDTITLHQKPHKGSIRNFCDDNENSSETVGDGDGDGDGYDHDDDHDDDDSLSQSSNTTTSSDEQKSNAGVLNENGEPAEHGGVDCATRECSQDSDGESDGESDESYNSDDEKVIAKIKNFPVQAILLEKCVSTLDNIMMNDELTTEEWCSILFQVIMTLVIYQHMFEFTHNDLHTNNVMFIETTEEYIYYLYKDQYYKVPTYGRIFKIIDFGRAIYKFRGELMCSDSFNFKGDAATQYNFGPYYNPNKPIVEPNYSFDLCRFACALFDYFINDIRKIDKICKSDPVVNLIVKWTLDDKGRNVLYKSSGEERYPDFKLYKMIARSVHNHIPSTQILDPLFDQFKITYKKYKKHASIAAKFLKDGNNTHMFINVDELPSYHNAS